MSFQSSRGQEVRAFLQGRVGFPFSEAELSPPLRQRINLVSNQKQQVDYSMWDVAQLSSKKDNYNVYFLVCLVIGVVTAFVIIGLFILPVAYYFHREKKKTEARILQKTQEAESLGRAIDVELSELSIQIHRELSAVHEARLRPIRAGGSQVFKETVVREVVMVPCSYCNCLMPQTSLACPNCGARRR